MTELAPTAKQTEIRLAMLKNGYTPLGSECKAVKIKNWSHLDVTEKLIERWKRREDLMTSGVRVDAPLVVMDFDIDDAATIDKVFAAIEAKDAVLGAALAAAPCRFGGGDKLALFLRSEDGVRGTWHSKAYYRPWDVESDESKAKLQRLEVFGAGNDGEDARYMATNGAHTLGPDGEVAREYIWEDGRDLTRVPVGDLPVITKAQVLLAVDTASEVLHDAGWVYEVSSKAGSQQALSSMRLCQRCSSAPISVRWLIWRGLKISATPTTCVCAWILSRRARKTSRGVLSGVRPQMVGFMYSTRRQGHGIDLRTSMCGGRWRRWACG
jgi:hypothetical protein